jgi:type I restriction enzyme S subunit
MNLPGNEKCMTTITNTISGATLKKLKAKAFPQGTIIFPKIGAAIATNKKRVLTQPSVVDNNVMGLIPKSHINSLYLYYWMLQFDLRSVSNIGPVPSMRKTEVERVSIPLPLPSEQRRIVEILDQADELRKKRAEADAKATRILPALFYEMFGDPATNPKGWNIKPLSDFEAQVRYGLGQPPKASTTGVALIRATNISRGTISPKNMIYVDPQDVPPGRSAFLKEDEVLVVRSGAYTGDIAQVTKEWEGCVAGYDLVITPGRYLTGEFVEAYLLMPFIQKGYFYNLKARAGQPHLNAAQVAATPFLDVPKDLQVQFSEVVQSIRILRKQRVAASDNLEKTFAVILHHAFTGDLTGKWREAHMRELLVEMEEQAQALETTNHTKSTKGKNS